MEGSPRMINIIKFVNARRQVIFIPSKNRVKLPVLQYLAAKTEPERDYTEREVTALLSCWLSRPDPDVARRLLIDEGLLARTIDGARYWRRPFDENWSIH